MEIAAPEGYCSVTASPNIPCSRYWTAWLAFVREQLLSRKLLSPHDLSLLKITDSVDEAVNEVLQFYSVYDSMRYIREKLVLRLHSPISDELLEKLNADFSDILVSGRIERTDAHPFELDEEHLLNHSRLSLHFNRRDAARLRQLIDTINRSPSENESRLRGLVELEVAREPSDGAGPDIELP